MLNQYFKREEFACKCGCGFDVVDVELLHVLIDIRETFNQPVRITSGCRCANHNEHVGGVATSQHVRGKAADVQVRGVDPQVVASFLDQVYPDRYGIGVAANFVHVDIRDDKPRRWTY